MRIAILMVVVLMVGEPVQAEWVNALKPQGTTAAVDLTLPIRIPARASSEETKAAQDLQHWVKEMTGRAPEIQSSDGEVASTRIATDEKLGQDGYRIEVKDRRLALFGAPGRGVINAVYA